MARFMRWQVEPLGDTAISVRLGSAIDEPTRIRVHRATAALAAASLAGVRDLVPGFTSIAVHYDLTRTSLAALIPQVEAALATAGEAPTPRERLVRIPVCYGGAFGPDLDTVAAQLGLATPAVIDLHASTEYRVHMLGFLPGFAYLGGLDPRLAVPRRTAPRERVPAGSVGIAGLQTGVYPLESPGGWQLIGQSPCRLFDPALDPPTLLQAGDRVRFEPIPPEAFGSAQADVA